MMCDCGEKPLTYYNVSNGIRVYKCARTKQIFRYKKIIEILESPKKPCNFYKEKQYRTENEKKTLQEKKKEKNKKISVPYTNLIRKIDFFIDTKFFVTFQEIELECEKLQIPIYNNHNETLYEFCCRVKTHCLKFSPKEETKLVIPNLVNSEQLDQ